MNIVKQCCCWLLVALLQLATPIHAYAEDVSSAQQTQLNEGELAQILAPIALYPDSLLTHILIAATYPLEVVEAQRWQQKNQQLSTENQVKTAETMQWDPSVTALVAFPTVLQKLSDDLKWTQALGDAFLQNEAQVLDSIQALRAQADNANSLDDLQNMQVTKVNNQIVIESVKKEVVYVPYYDPRVVYGTWHWTHYPPVYWAVYPGYVTPGHGHFYWHTGVHISFNYFFSAFHWHNHHVVVIHHKKSHHYRHHARITTSHGAKRWSHKPQHRRGVAYSNNSLRHKYNSPSRARSQVIRSPNNKQVAKKREVQFAKKLQQPTRHKAHLANGKSVKSHQPAKSRQAVKSHQPAKSRQLVAKNHQPAVNKQKHTRSQQTYQQPRNSHKQARSNSRANQAKRSKN
ncbi:DUF3300 domain-containing protein [Shewanella youngdeokensis]|uniref:DUF3300 domain-containing protein n=1 Tax=Shewanella youngdeokensis TaxID=2999068 RepID=A0ABZ0K2J0_9GAMM|nr:DUF3300 domain-containing protein [Shewanella sp. DAU334]